MENLTLLIKDIFFYFGILSFVFIVLYLLLRRVGINLLLGSGIVESAKKWVREAPKVSVETNVELAANIFKRLTRVGLFALIVALIPITLLWQQNKLLSQQNKKIDSQNNRVFQQTYLQEAERRSSLVFLFNNVLDRIVVTPKNWTVS